ncbi:hypothetical protein ATO12_20760 [Aquimarina atlantica]|uniref:Uncharacterized protein n=1 Tax=Aquimarina atlantica TaxID=1317122 RepID=A0A023BRJ0_9FLAO|nr:hypothetical protein [Aquimarina atlantica]EZH72569.1 hypothetical protein ATO12_20760 [Aquimarina atlantica]
MIKKIDIKLSVILLLIMVIMISSAQERKIGEVIKDQNMTTCTNFECLEKNKNKRILIKGILRTYTPNTTGKGAGHMFWDWEILLDNKITIPVISKDQRLDLSAYNKKNVLIDGDVFYGIVIGDPEGQNATGYRIDAHSIQEQAISSNKK